MTKTSGHNNGEHAPFWISFVAGGASGTIGAVITCPLEVVKTRLQSSMYQTMQTAIPITTFRASPIRATWFHISGTMQALRSIYVTEGIAALWKGVGATIVGVMPARAIYFSVYSKSKSLLTEVNHGHESSLVHLTSAGMAGIITATATNPIWLIKTKMQLQSNSNMIAPRYRNSFDCLRLVVRQDGFRALYKGLTASYIGVAESTIQWVLYEKMKTSLTKHRLVQQGLDPSVTKVKPSDVLGWIDYFAIAATAKLVAAVVAYPHEVLRTRLREDTTKYRGLWQTMARIFREEGMVAFYGGMTAHLLRVVPNSAIMFFCYEFMMNSYSKLVSDSTA